MNGKIVFGAGLGVGIAAMVAIRLSGGGAAADVSYADVPLFAKVAQSPLIVTGTVIDVSATRWNQDDGKFWELTETDAYGEQIVDSAVPYHTVVMQVDRVFANNLGVATDVLALTVIGMGSDQVAAYDLNDAQTSGVISLASNTVSALEGDRVIAFVRKGQLAWRDGTMRPVLAPMGAPGSSVVSEAVVNSGALDEVNSFAELLAEVAQAHADGSATE